MIHLINFLIKIIANAILTPAHLILIILSLLLWDKRFFNMADKLQNEYIWGLDKSE